MQPMNISIAMASAIIAHPNLVIVRPTWSLDSDDLVYGRPEVTASECRAEGRWNTSTPRSANSGLNCSCSTVATPSRPQAATARDLAPALLPVLIALRAAMRPTSGARACGCGDGCGTACGKRSPRWLAVPGAMPPRIFMDTTSMVWELESTSCTTRWPFGSRPHRQREVSRRSSSAVHEPGSLPQAPAPAGALGTELRKKPWRLESGKLAPAGRTPQASAKSNTTIHLMAPPRLLASHETNCSLSRRAVHFSTSCIWTLGGEHRGARP